MCYSDRMWVCSLALLSLYIFGWISLLAPLCLSLSLYPQLLNQILDLVLKLWVPFEDQSTPEIRLPDHIDKPTYLTCSSQSSPLQAEEAMYSAKEASQAAAQPPAQVLPPTSLQLQPTLRLDAGELPQARDSQSGRGKGKGKEPTSISSDQAGTTVHASQLLALAKPQSSMSEPGSSLSKPGYSGFDGSSQAGQGVETLVNAPCLF